MTTPDAQVSQTHAASREDLAAFYEATNARMRAECDARLQKADLFDEDGYPTEDALWLLAHWPFDDLQGWIRLAKSLWVYEDMTWRVEVVPNDFQKDQLVKRVNVSTFGWSGNESVVSAMQAHVIFWPTCWVQSRRGGHFIFELDCSVEI